LTIESRSFQVMQSSIINRQSSIRGQPATVRLSFAGVGELAASYLGCGVGSDVLPFLRRYIDD
jgi:transcriptional regulator with AAA-type ATPase domain